MLHKTYGFTLIELLCVIVIIASLASILFPVFANAKLAAKVSKDLTQLSQIGKAMQLYASENDDRTPFAITERDRSDPEFQDSTMPLVEWNHFKQTIPAVNLALRPFGADPQVFSSPIDNGCRFGMDKFAPNCFAQFGSSYVFLSPGKSLTSFADPTNAVYGMFTFTPKQVERIDDIFSDAVYIDGHVKKTVGFINFTNE